MSDIQNVRLEINRIINSNNIKENESILVGYIPEIQSMIGFDHKHPHHHLDVWEHTKLALSLSNNDIDVRLALLLACTLPNSASLN